MRKKLLLILLSGCLLCGCGVNAQKAVPKESTDSEKTTQKKSADSGKTTQKKSADSGKSKQEESAEDKKDVSEERKAIKKAGITIEDSLYNAEDQKGNWEIHYPVLTSEEVSVEECNASVEKLLDYIFSQHDTESESDIRLEYEVKMQSKQRISILFMGMYYKRGAAHPLNLSYGLNFDLKEQKELHLEDVIKDTSNLLERSRAAMEEQCAMEIKGALSMLSDETLERQIFEEAYNFYLEGKKVYLRLTLTTGSQYFEYVSLDG